MLKRFFAVGYAALAFACAGHAASDRPPLRRANSTIRAWILDRTPLATNLPQVSTVLDQHIWNERVFRERENINGKFLSGNRAVVLDSGLGGYGVLLGHTEVRALWIFSDGVHLSDVQVSKATIGL